MKDKTVKKSGVTVDDGARLAAAATSRAVPRPPPPTVQFSSAAKQAALRLLSLR